MNFSEKLKALRDQHGLKQSELADRSGLTTNKVQRYEQSNQKPKGDDALALARALGVSADYVLDDALPFPPPEEHLSEKVAIIGRLEGLIGALLSRDGEGDIGQAERPDVVHLPVLKLGAGFDVSFDATGAPVGHKVRDLYFNALGEGKFFAAELHGSSMRGPGDAGFSLGETVVFKVVGTDEIATGDYVYVRTEDHGLFRQAFTHGDRLRLRALNPADPEVVVAKSDVQHICRLVRRVKDY
jgi:transcriptional regulator with XRE-family HTH domain